MRLVEGNTFLIPKIRRKSTSSQIPTKTCLPTTYKLLTGIIIGMMYHHLTQQEGLEAEQKGCKRGCYGTIDHLLLNKARLENCKMWRTKLSTAWIDYKKAFNSVPHSYMIKCMQIYLKNQFPNNQTDWESNGTLEYLIHITAVGRKYNKHCRDIGPGNRGPCPIPS